MNFSTYLFSYLDMNLIPNVILLWSTPFRVKRFASLSVFPQISASKCQSCFIFQAHKQADFPVFPQGHDTTTVGLRKRWQTELVANSPLLPTVIDCERSHLYTAVLCRDQVSWEGGEGKMKPNLTKAWDNQHTNTQ